VREASYSIPTKWLKKIKVGIMEFISRSTFRSSQTKIVVTFNVPSGINVTFWPRRIYDRIYDGRRISRHKIGYFTFAFWRSDNFRSKNCVAESSLEMRDRRFSEHNCEHNNAYRFVSNEENCFL
jgi:hypothetical protein